MTRGRGFYVGLLLVATSLWGASSVVLSEVSDVSGMGAPLLASGGALMLLLSALFGRVSRHSLLATLLDSKQRKSLLLVGFLEALNLGLYAIALALGPVTVVVALHLTSPVLLVAWLVVTRRKKFSPAILVQVVMIATALCLLAFQPVDGPLERPLLAGILALGSAVAVSILIYSVVRLAPEAHPDVYSAGQLGLAALATSPLVFSGATTPSFNEILVLTGAGALFLGPGFAIYWRALRGIEAATAGIIGLNEAVVATLISVAIFNDRVTTETGVASVLVLVAVIVEALSRRTNRSR